MKDFLQKAVDLFASIPDFAMGLLLLLFAILAGAVGALIGVPLWIVFVAKIVLGAGFYALLSELLHLEAWRELKEILVGYMPRRK